MHVFATLTVPKRLGNGGDLAIMVTVAYQLYIIIVTHFEGEPLEHVYFLWEFVSPNAFWSTETPLGRFLYYIETRY